ncbi:MAG: phytanoyl-CoA dioxygenase, partial [Pseudomonadota bacterium]
MNDVTAQTATASAPTRAEHQTRMAIYAKEGEARAEAIGNRGPIRFDDDGRLHPDIVDAYWKHGFYIFEGIVAPVELEELRQDAANMLERAPVHPGAMVDAKGRPALGRDWARDPFSFIRPLSDPWGGTDLLGGRHPSKMTEAKADADAPEHVV